MRGRARQLALFALIAGALAGCGTSSDRGLHLAMAALNTPTPRSAPAANAQPVRCNDLTDSLRPPATLPKPNAMPSGSYMDTIQKRGYLVAGVNAAALDFGYLNPVTGQVEGFEIDLVRQLAKAIFGNPKAYRLKTLTVPERIPFVQQGKVDVVVDAVTITCERRRQVDFSTVYYEAKQRVLVPTDSGAQRLADLAGKRVCATAGSAPIQVMQQQPSPPIAVGAPQAIDCLVYLQEGKVAAISTDDAILLGLAAQDPNTKLIGPSLAKVPYGMAISKAHPEFVRYVNGVLARLRADGTWARIYHRWLKKGFGPVPAPPAAQYEG